MFGSALGEILRDEMKFGLMAANLMGNVKGPAATAIARTAEEVGLHSISAIEHAVVPKSYASTYPHPEDGKLFKGSRRRCGTRS
ncbi:MAG: hypothetical protein ACKVHU_12260 [Acidimicrobiales bacterium]